MATKQTLIALAFSVALATAAQAECLTDAQAADMVAHYVARTPAANPENLSDADGACSRAKLNQLLAQRVGKVIGYKAGLTNPAVQKRFKYDAPLRGTLFKSMLTTDGAELLAAFGTRPVFEADLIVEVADPVALARAETPLAALRALRSYAPYIELPDLMVADPSTLGGPMLAMVNVGARAGVVGKAIPVKATQELADAFASMTVSLTDGNGVVLDSGKGNATLGNPLNAAIWLARDLAADHMPLKRGDLLSLGSFTKLLPPRPGLAVKATYEGLPGKPGVSVRFR